MLYKHRFTLLSIVLICAMFAIFQLKYDPGTSVTKPFMSKEARQQGHGEVPIGGAFELVNHKGKVVTHEDVKGNFYLMFFGFTFCPDICPMSLALLADAYTQLTPQQQQMLDVYMVGVDSPRDTPQKMAEYVPAFHPDFTGLSGTPEQIKQAAKAYLVYYAAEEPDEHGDYMVAHSGFIHLMSPDGKYLTHFTHKASTEEVVAILRQALQK